VHGVGVSELKLVDHIGKLRCPVLIVAGTLDRHTTVDDIQALFAAASQPKALWLISGAAQSIIWNSRAKTTVGRS
jgi:fermentation-respiration switch protein FrsA (DUF1100 family)